MATLIDPLADLKAEIAAAAPPPDPVLEETAAEEKRLAEEEEKTRAAEAAAPQVEEEASKPAKKGKKEPAEKMVPVERMNEYAVRVRQLEKEKEDLERKLNPPPEPPPQAPKTEAQIRAEERALARLDIQLEAFSLAGSEKYTAKAFDAACDKIAKLIAGPSNLISLAIEATGTPKDAAVAIMALGQGDAREIEAFLRLSQIRQATHLSKLAATRTRKAVGDDEPAPRRRAQVEEEEEDEEVKPLRPLSAGNAVNESLGDDVPMDLWVERFDKQVLNKGKLAH